MWKENSSDIGTTSLYLQSREVILVVGFYLIAPVFAPQPATWLLPQHSAEGFVCVTETQVRDST